MSIGAIFLNFISGTIGDTLWAWFVMLPIALPIILGVISWHVFRRYNLTREISRKKWALLEFKIPRDMFKSPLAMEIALNGAYQTTQGQPWTRFSRGRHRDWFSFEIISIEGHIHFCCYTPEYYRNYFETQMYAQFPSIEIHEVSDYVANVDYLEHPEKWDLMGIEMSFDPANSPMPIKTYVDYGLDKDPKEEYKNDPLLGILEHMGSMGKGEQFWLQIMVMPTKHNKEIKANAEAAVKKLLRRDRIIDKEAAYSLAEAMPSSGERSSAEVIERALTKPYFDVGIRSVYIAEKKYFKATRQPTVKMIFRPFNAPGFKNFDDRIATASRHEFDIRKNLRLTKMKRLFFDAYRKRSYFYPPYKRPPIAMTTEEVATLYHFPGAVGKIPTLERIQSKRGEAPVNLPF